MGSLDGRFSDDDDDDGTNDRSKANDRNKIDEDQYSQTRLRWKRVESKQRKKAIALIRGTKKKNHSK